MVSWEKSNAGIVPNPSHGDTPLKRSYELLERITEKEGLEQIVDKPTRQRNILDLIYTNTPQDLSSCTVTNIEPVSDHNLVRTQLTTSTNSTEDEQNLGEPSLASQINFRAINVEAYKTEMDKVNWEKTLDVPNDKMSSAFVNEVCAAAIRVNAPTFRNTRNKKAQEKIQQLGAERQKLHKQNDHPSVTNETQKKNNNRIKEINEELSKTLKDEREAEEIRVIKTFRVNSRDFYKYANKFRKTKDRVGPLKKGNNYESGPKQMAEILSEQYDSVFSTPKDNINDLEMPQYTNTSLLTDFQITRTALISAMQDIDSASTPGPDDLPAVFYNMFAEQLATPLMIIWRRSLDTGSMPETTLLAIITPIFKGGDKTNPANYRPIALTNHIVKIFERVVRRELVEHLQRNNHMNHSQHGYKSGHSTITQLLAYLDSILSILETGDDVDIIYLDLAKAFDKVDHGILLHKLYTLGVRGRVLKWLEQFLRNRKQMVRVNGFLSHPRWVKSGVPQGSVLGPLLFIIMMIDIDHNLKCGLGSYADDTKLWKAVLSLINLQKDLDTAHQWIDDNNMSVNGKKYEHMHAGKNKQYSLFLSNEGEIIQTSKVVRDLGVYVSEDLKFRYHITTIVKKATRVAQWVLRTFKTRETFPMLILLKTIVVPILEYACVIWSPNQTELITLLERVQRKFTSRFSQFNTYDENLGMNVCHVPYSERLRKLNIYSLERRRERYMILFLYKILIGTYPNPGLDLSSIDRNTRTGIKVTPKINLHAPDWVQTIRGASFFNKAPQLFNILPLKLRQPKYINNPTPKYVEKFKKGVDRFLETIPDTPNTEGLPRDVFSNSILFQIKYRVNPPTTEDADSDST